MTFAQISTVPRTATWLEATRYGDDAGRRRPDRGRQGTLASPRSGPDIPRHELAQVTWPAGPRHWRRCCGPFRTAPGVAAEPGRVLEVAASFGFVRETNYGRLFDVRVEPAPGNLAFTSRAIRPHTDNPYRDPAPTVQLLHCLRAAGEGGDTGLVDGSRPRPISAADPESFGTLTRHPFRSVMSIKKPTYGRACRSSSSARPAGSAGSASTTGRCGRCGGRTPRSPRSTPPTGGGLSCWPSPAAAHRAARARGLPGLRQHPGAARPHRLQHEPALARAAPARLLRRPGRPGQHPGRTDT